MFKINFHLVIYRYELILAVIVLLLTGSIVVSSKDRVKDLAIHDPRYPYRIALTFDDGPHPEYADKLVSVLRQNNVPATFFVVGKMVLQHPELIQELSLAGHEIEVHGFTHTNLTKLSAEEVEKELTGTRSIIEDITGKKCFFFRPPGGQFNNKVIKKATSLGMEMVLWSVFPKDHEENDPQVIIQRVMSQATDGGVVLLHSGRDPTLAALPEIIKRLREKGYEFVTVERLRTSASPEEFAWLKGY
jgi:peptidoglycan/xylan/chitin deacetylase (PgdA/CDA1 family)